MHMILARYFLLRHRKTATTHTEKNNSPFSDRAIDDVTPTGRPRRCSSQPIAAWTKPSSWRENISNLVDIIKYKSAPNTQGPQIYRLAQVYNNVLEFWLYKTAKNTEFGYTISEHTPQSFVAYV